MQKSRLALSTSLLAIFFLLGAFYAAGADENFQISAKQQLSRVNQLWYKSEIDSALVILETLRASPDFETLTDERVNTLYNLACGYSLTERTGEALRSLEAAIQAGFSNYRHILRDSDLENIRGEACFAEIVAPLKSETMLWEGAAFATPYSETLSRAEKAAGVSALWAEARYGFVYFDRVPELNWDSLYITTLEAVEQTTSTAEYYRELQRFCSQLRDGHSNVDVPNELYLKLYAKPPLETRLVDGHVLVNDVWNEDSLKRDEWLGMEILAVDGIPVKEYAKERVEPYLSASTEQGRLLAIYGHYLLCGASGKPVELELKGEKGKPEKKTIARSYYRILKSGDPVEFRKLDGNIAYLALNNFGSDMVTAKFDSLYPMIEKSDGLILDIRSNPGGNSRVGWNILGYLVDEPFATISNQCRDYRAPYRAWGKARPIFDDPADDWPVNGEHCYRKPVIVLTSTTTGSAAEDFCVAFDQADRGLIIGQPTNGSTGQPVRFPLPGGGYGRVCTIRSMYADGTEYVGVGIQPDILIEPTIEDIRAGRDRVLEAALEKIR